MLKFHERRLIINLNDLRQTNPTMTIGLLQSPLEWVPPLEFALKEVAGGLNDPSYEYDLSRAALHVGFEGSFGALHTTPRQLSSKLLSHLVCLDGIITSCSLVRPKLLRSIHYSESRKAFLMREYYDATMLDSGGLVTAMNYPMSGGEDPSLISEFGLSSYRNYQTVTMQEMPERAPAGQLPRTVDIVLDDDLVDAVKPGDRVQIIGVYKSLASTSGGTVPSHFRAVVVALNVRSLINDLSAVMISEDDLQNIRALSRRKDIFTLLSRSLAPSIYGHDWVKRAVLLMLLGGVEKNLANGTHLRGDINLMLVGDPSTAKSQMLRFVLAIAPLAIATTGRGSSGVGLTAAVTTDRETGERRLEAGAMVLADRGVVCIDEFDKMNDVDRVAIHEVMEQQTVTIAKAGIHASLNARCAVLAAANPIWGQYRETASPQENIRLPDSLLSRFDLLFIILDTAESTHDRRISSHVLKMHRYIPMGLADGQPIHERLFEATNSDDDDENSIAATPVFQRHYGLGTDSTAAACPDEEEEDDDEIVTLSFLKKYINYARIHISPVLTKAAIDNIVEAYTEFRQKRDVIAESPINEAKTFPVTPRTLETLIRLATAHAKARLSTRVEKKDAKVARELVEYCLYKEVKKKPSKRHRKTVEKEQEETSDEDEEPSGGIDKDQDKDKDKMRENRTEFVPNDMIYSPLQGLSLEEVIDTSQVQPLAASLASTSYTTPFVSVDSQLENSLRFIDPSQDTPPLSNIPSETVGMSIRAALNHLRSLSTSAVFATTVNELHDEIARSDPALAASITTKAILAILEDMQRMNQVMLSDGNIYII